MPNNLIRPHDTVVSRFALRYGVESRADAAAILNIAVDAILDDPEAATDLARRALERHTVAPG